MRRWLSFDVEGTRCAATLDEAAGPHGLLIVSGGNEIRSGAHRGMARLASDMARGGNPVFRFDRRGIGDSEGENAEFAGSSADIAAAVAAFRAAAPHVTHITAYGNCDAAAALILFHHSAGIDRLILSNPWTIDEDAADAADAPDTAHVAALPPSAAIRARYLSRLKNPREWKRLLTGGVNLRKLFAGLRAASRTTPDTPPSRLVAQLANALTNGTAPILIIVAEQDRTAQKFLEQWRGPAFAAVRDRIPVARWAGGSHSFADTESWQWFSQHIRNALAITCN